MCQNGGICSLNDFDYKCTCIGGFYGKNCQHKILNSTIFKNSTILTNEQSLDLIELIGLNKTNVKLVYQASRDGFDPSIFHSKCDGIERTLTVIKSENSNIFGGYTSVDWSGNHYNSDSTAYLFSLVNTYNESVQMNVIQSIYATFTRPEYYISFGGGPDLRCSDELVQCYSNLGHSYQLPSFLTPFTNEAQSFLAGSFYFKPDEIEVYWIDF